LRYSIYEGNLEKLEKKLKTISNKCIKFGCTFKYEIIGEEYRDIKIEGIEHKIKFIIIEAEGIAKVNDWVFVASVEHTSSGNIINKAIHDIEIPERYYNSGSFCEHCNTKRSRKDTYIIMNEKTKEFKQVGKSCLKDFTGGLSAESIAYYYSFFDELEKEQNNTNFYSVGFSKYYDTNVILHYIAETIKHFGFMKTDSDRPTAYRSFDYYLVDHKGYIFTEEERTQYRNEMDRVNFNINSKDTKELVKKATEWILIQNDDNNFIHNLKVIVKQDYITYKHLGILASLFAVYKRSIDNEEFTKKKENEINKQRNNSNYVGNIGDKITFDVANFKYVTGWQNSFGGYVTMYRIIDTLGNIYIWKTSSNVEYKTETDFKKCIGTVKAHTEFNQIKQTELIRCKLIK